MAWLEMRRARRLGRLCRPASQPAEVLSRPLCERTILLSGKPADQVDVPQKATAFFTTGHPIKGDRPAREPGRAEGLSCKSEPVSRQA